MLCYNYKFQAIPCFLFQVGKDLEWASWVEYVTHASHVSLAFNSSVNFYIYFAKHWRSILGIQETNTMSQPTEAHTLRNLDGYNSAR